MLASVDEADLLWSGIGAQGNEMTKGGDSRSFDNRNSDSFTRQKLDKYGERLLGLEDCSLLSLRG